MAQQQQRPASAGTPSQTTTQQRSQQGREEAPRVLRLRGTRNATERSVQWADDVVDNEGLGRKSSKGMEQNPSLPPPPAPASLFWGMPVVAEPADKANYSVLHIPQAKGGRRVERRVIIRFLLVIG